MRSAATAEGPDGDPNPYRSPAAEVGGSPVIATGGPSWSTFLNMGVVAGTGSWLAWSLWMSVFMGLRLRSVLLGPGAGFGLFFGVFFGGYMTFLMRPATVTLPFAQGDDPLARIDAEMATLGYRTVDRGDGRRTYGPRRWFRPRAFEIVVDVRPGEATLAGPKETLKVLKKRLKR